MPIAAGTRLGPYEVVAPIGAGGMGEVYRGTDTRLNRVVALKILPSHLSSNPELRERFDREARAISAITHPHICTLYDVGHQDGTDYLVMEFVEGETLERRVQRGPLPIEQVLRYGIEIADALDRAHRHGIIHRDLKPGNIMLTKSGAKLLDFGLAKVAAQNEPVLQISHLPTEQRQLTQEGTILGTFQYMAPEQLEGQEADARTDIFALGAVLYEMLTGRRAFEEKTKTSLIAAIVDRDPPPIASIQPLTPPAFERVVKTCLAKDPEDRWQNARDLANEMRRIQKGDDHEVQRLPRRNAREAIAWGVAAIAIVALVSLGYFYRKATSEPQLSVTSSILPPDKAVFAFQSVNGSFALSPDGRKIAMLATADGKTMLWVRPLNSNAAQPLVGTENARFPFWSADSRYLGFFASGKLQKIDVSGGPPQTICPVGGQPRGATWSADGVIAFTPNPRDPIYRVAAEGGTPQAITKLARGEFSHRWPWFLPDGRHFLFLDEGQVGGGSDRNVVTVGSLDSSERRPLMRASGAAMYAAPGYIVFVRERMLLAQRFDADKLQLSGEAFPLVERIQEWSSTTVSAFSVSNNGSLAYQRGVNATDLHLAWVDRSGKELEALTPEGDYNHPQLSHDGQRVAYEAPDATNGLRDIWTLDLRRHVSTRLTFEPQDEWTPVWTPDDRTIIYSYLQPGGLWVIVKKPSAGSAAAEVLYASPTTKFVSDLSSDGRIILFQNYEQTANKTAWDIWRLALDSRTASPLIASPFNEVSGSLSPNLRWIAYQSDLAGQPNIYIEPYPPTGAKYQVSTVGGNNPRWSRDSRELFYRTIDERLMAVNVNEVARALEISAPVALFTMHLSTESGFQYDVAPDGKRFLMNISTMKGSVPITLVTHWTAEIR